MEAIVSIVKTCFVYTLASVYSGYVILVAFWAFFKHCLSFWRSKERSYPPVLIDPDFQHGYAKLNSGLRLHYAEMGDRSRPLMLCLHGFPEFWYSWRHQMKDFSSEYWVVAPDLRGYGDSDKPKGRSSYHIDKLVEDIVQLIPALGRSKIDVLLAHDWGGAVAWRFVGLNPNLVERFIPMNIPHPSAFTKTVRSNRTQFLKSWYVFFFQMPFLPEWYFQLKDFFWMNMMFANPKTKRLVVSHEELEAFKYTFSKPGASTYPINYYRAVDFVKDVKTPRVAVPTCLIFGTEDLALETSMAVDSEKYCEPGKFQLQKVDGVSHWVQQEAPERVNQIIREFLQSSKVQ